MYDLKGCQNILFVQVSELRHSVFTSEEKVRNLMEQLRSREQIHRHVEAFTAEMKALSNQLAQRTALYSAQVRISLIIDRPWSTDDHHRWNDHVQSSVNRSKMIERESGFSLDLHYSSDTVFNFFGIHVLISVTRHKLYIQVLHEMGQTTVIVSIKIHMFRQLT